MAVKNVVLCTCDRCERTIEETPQVEGEGFERSQPLVYLEAKRLEQASITFHDLCKKCQGRVAQLISQIRLEKKDDDKTQESSAGAAEEIAASGDDTATKSNEDMVDASPKAKKAKGKPKDDGADAGVPNN